MNFTEQIRHAIVTGKGRPTRPLPWRLRSLLNQRRRSRTR